MSKTQSMLAIAAVLGVMSAASALAQEAAPAAPQLTLVAPRGWSVPRLADGKPDIQGIWTNKTVTPFERPTDLGTKEFFTADEARDVRRAHARAQQSR